MKLQPVLACPNTPPCPHWLHDIEDWDDPRPTCVEDDCPCGKGGA